MLGSKRRQKREAEGARGREESRLQEWIVRYGVQPAKKETDGGLIDTVESGGYRFVFTKKIENVTGDAEMITLGRERENREREDLARVEESYEEGAHERG